MPYVIRAVEYDVPDPAQWVLSQNCFLEDPPSKRTVQKWIQEYREKTADVVSRYQEAPDFSVHQRRKAQHVRMSKEIARMAVAQAELENDLQTALDEIRDDPTSLTEDGRRYTVEARRQMAELRRLNRAEQMQLQKACVEIEREYRQGLASVTEENLDDMAIQDELVSLVSAGAAKLDQKRLQRIADAVSAALDSDQPTEPKTE